eukprot:TRINITY_DN14972_c0_g1_i1.p1 TRINITY_DN14972_c0_g1~~TRINITY_DN14972_c0_g1_i1.p1  ORF type:complete len:145 (+),score=4.51 TRINITY_DN14972_c0_g1_i1:37-471(+)
MPAGFGWKLQEVLTPVRFIATISDLVALLMCMDGVDSNLQASFVQGATIPSNTTLSAKAAIGLSIACVLICLGGMMIGYTTLNTASSFLQIPLHSVAAALLLNVHYLSSHYVRFWHIFFVFILPSTLIEVVQILTTRASKKVSW